MSRRNAASRKRMQKRRRRLEIMEWIRFIIGAAFLIIGLAVFIIEMIGVFKFKYVMNRMHAAAMGDTLGIGCTILGLIIINGANLTSLKLACIIVFLWFSSPTSSHLIARLELTTDEEPQKHYRRMPLRKLEEELAAQDGNGKPAENGQAAQEGREAQSAQGSHPASREAEREE